MGSQRVAHDGDSRFPGCTRPSWAWWGYQATTPLPTSVLSRGTLAPELPGSLPETFSEQRGCLGLFPLSCGVGLHSDLMTLPPTLPPRYYPLQAF